MSNPAVGKSQGADTPKNLYSNKTYRTTHNSYSGEARGTIRQQLDSGVRCIELDLCITKKDGAIKLEIGHKQPGNFVSHADDNPNNNDLGDWLDIISTWCNENGKDEDPITISFDLKDPEGSAKDLSWKDNGMPLLEAAVQSAFDPERLFVPPSPKRKTPPPDYDGLRGKVLCLYNVSKLTSEVLFYIPPFTPDNAESSNYFINFSTDDLIPIMPDQIQMCLDRGFAVRVYDIDHELHGLHTGITFAATDHPYQNPYQEYQRDNPGLTPKINFRSVKWADDSDRYDSGKEPSIAINENGMAIEVHKTQKKGSEALFYRVGKLSTHDNIPSIHFNPPLSDSAHSLGEEGIRPMVAICGKNVCVVYKLKNDTIMFKTGLLDATRQAVDWDNAKSLQVQGLYPSISMCSPEKGKVLLLVTLVQPQSDPEFNTLCWKVGEMDPGGSRVTWQDLNRVKDQRVDVPEMDVNDELELTMVWAHEEHVYCRIGFLKKEVAQWEVKWEVSVSSDDVKTWPLMYDEGHRPSVASLGHGAAVEIHRSATTPGLWSRTGKRSGTVEVWNISKEVTQGDVSRIAAGDGYVMEVHKSENVDELWYTLATYS